MFHCPLVLYAKQSTTDGEMGGGEKEEEDTRSERVNTTVEERLSVSLWM
jgi:hypothetical protein